MIRKYIRELRKQIRMALAAAIGFIIAFAWKDYLLGIANRFFGNLSQVMPHLSAFLVAFIFTLIGTALILITSRIME